MANSKKKSIKSVAGGNTHKTIAHVRHLHSRAPAASKPPVNAAGSAVKPLEWESRQSLREEQITEETPVIKKIIPDLFLNSLRSLTQKDIIPDKDASKKSKKGEKLIANLMLVVCAAVFVFSSFKLIEKMIGYSEAAESYEGIRDIMNDASEDAGSEFVKLKRNLENKGSTELLKKMEAGEEPEQENPDDYESAEVSELDKLKSKLQFLSAKNPDTYGWINISELNIDYPVVKTTNNDFYLEHNFYKVFQASGAIYADFRVEDNVLENRNLIIYGHNMADGTMFENLLKYRYNYNKALLERSVIELRTMDGIFVYKIFSVYVTDKYYPYITTDFASDEEWFAFLLEIQERSIHKTDIELKPDDVIITLSTCTNSWDNRFAVHAVLTEVRN